MKKLVSEVFVTEGLPDETYVDPPNYGLISIDITNPQKPVIIEGQSGTGKTTTVKKILERIGKGDRYKYYTARKPADINEIRNILDAPSKGVFIIDDFHRLPSQFQARLADIAKISAEQGDFDNYPKLVLIGINQVGAGLIHFAPDVAKRLGIHKIQPADEAKVLKIVLNGADSLNVSFDAPEKIYNESKGDYWLTQKLCQIACGLAGVTETIVGEPIIVPVDLLRLRREITDNNLNAAYYEAVKEFCRGRRFRPGNDPYYKLLRAVSEQENTNVDLTQLANSRDDIRQSINNIKDHRLTVLLSERANASKYFYYNSDTKNFSIEDPAMFYFIRHLDWDRCRTDCGFRPSDGREYKWEVAISFAGENRDLARYISDQLEELDVAVFYDENFESNYLGKAWSKEFERIFKDDSRLVLCLLDKNHKEKIWPTFERQVFVGRVDREEVIPVYLDDTNFPGIPSDIIGIKFKYPDDEWQKKADERIIFKMIDRLG